MRVDAAPLARRVLFPVVVSGLSALAVASHASRSRAPLRRCCATRRPAAPSASDTGEASEALAVAAIAGVLVLTTLVLVFARQRRRRRTRSAR